MINKEKVYELVDVFYQPTFKTFYVNSVNGKDFVKPVGVFVSLGITTSKKVLEEIKNIISETPGYNAVIAEISSKRVKSQFLNTLKNTEPKQYKLGGEDLKKEKMRLFDKEMAEEELNRIKSIVSSNQEAGVINEITPKITKLQNLIKRLNDSCGWEDHLICEDEENYRIYHLNTNYKKEGDIEYRIGIYVTETK